MVNYDHLSIFLMFEQVYFENKPRKSDSEDFWDLEKDRIMKRNGFIS